MMSFFKKMSAFLASTISAIQEHFIYILIGSGFFGFTISMFVYIRSERLSSQENKFTFYEIYINRNSIIDSFNRDSIQTLRTILAQDTLQQKVASSDSLYRLIQQHLNKAKDTAIRRQVKEDSTKNEALKATGSDTSNGANQYAALSETFRKYRPGKIIKFADSAQVLAAIASQKNCTDTRQIRYLIDFLMYDTLHKDVPLKKTIALSNYIYQNGTTAFFKKYAGFGLWVLSIAASIAIWFILIIIFTVDMYNYYKKVNDPLKQTGLLLSKKKLSLLMLYSFGLVGLFIGVQFLTVYDDSVIPVNLFTRHYHNKFMFLLITGSLISAFFFGGYLTMGEVLKEITALMPPLKEKQASAAATGNTAALTILNPQIKSLEEICSLSLNNLNKYFTITTFILTSVVVITGILFNSINTLDFSIFYKESFRSQFLNTDFIYLFGGLYSLLILLFYLPLRLSFSSSQKNIAQPHSPPPPGNSQPFYKQEDFLNRLKETITISSPLLAAIVQLVINFLSGNGG